MKIAIDENIPIAIVKMLTSLARENDSAKHIVVDAKRYRPIAERGDENWIRRFARARGHVVVTADTRIRANLHEQAAFYRAGMITFFFDAKWHRLPLNQRAAVLMLWWPLILEKAQESQPGDSWEIPARLSIKEMRCVTPPAEAIAKHPKAKGKIPPSRASAPP